MYPFMKRIGTQYVIIEISLNAVKGKEAQREGSGGLMWYRYNVVL